MYENYYFKSVEKNQGEDLFCDQTEAFIELITDSWL